MRQHIFAKQTAKRIATLFSAFVVAVSALSAVLPFVLSQQADAAGGSQVVYNSLPNFTPLKAGYPSQPFQAQQVSEFGDEVKLGGSNRNLQTVTVTMINWAKFSDWSSDPRYSRNSASYAQDITLNIYSSNLTQNGTPSTLLASKTQTVDVPWRPESDPACGSTANGSGWKVDGVCYDFAGVAFNATFDFSNSNVTLPNEVIASVAFNTQSYGTNPVGVVGPYNSLNVAVPDSQLVSTGTDIDPNGVFINAKTNAAGAYVDAAPGVGIFRYDTGWGQNGTVALQITASPTETAVPVGAGFYQGSNIVPSGKTFNGHDTINNIEFRWNTVGSPTDAYITHISYPDHTTADVWTGTRNVWIGKTKYVNNYFGQKGEGTYTYSVKARSAVTGLWSSFTNPISLIYDATSPTASFTTTPPTYVNGDFHVSGIASDNVALGSVFFDVRDNTLPVNQQWKAGCVSAPQLVYSADYKSATIECDINTSALVDGHTYTLRIHAGDKAGYGGGEESTIVIDRTNPRVFLTTPHSGQLTSGSLTVSGTASDANGISRVLITIGKRTANNVFAGYEETNVPATWDGSNFSYQVNLPEFDGTYYVRAIAYDKAGNSKMAGVDGIKVDSTPPSVSVNSLSTTNTTPSPTGTIDDPFADVKVTVSNSSDTYNHTYTATKSGNTWTADILNALAVGVYDVTVTATDLAGNTGTGSGVLTIEATTVFTPTTTTPTTQLVLGPTAASFFTPAPQGTGGSDTTTTTPTDQAVEGAQTEKSNTNNNDQAVEGASTTKGPWSLWGVAWYWWLVILAILGAIIWWLIAGYRRNANEA